MAVELYADFADFKQYVGGRINTSMEITSLESTIYETARLHIVPALSLSQYEALVAASSPTSAQTALKPYVKRALAVLTMFEWSKVGGIEVGESGIHRVETETRKAAFRYQEKAYQQDAREKGYECLEVMLKFLSDNASTYSAWAATDEAIAHRTALLNYGSTFRLMTDQKIDRYSFECLRPIISSVQTLGVEQQLPASFWTGFITRYVANTLTNPEKEVLKMMRKAIAHKALEEATAQHWVTIKAGRVYVTEEFGEQNQYNATTPSTSLLGLGQRNNLWGDRYTCMWKQYIMDHPDDFSTVFDTSSGGSSTNANAWHINTTAEDEDAANATHERKSGATFVM